MKDTHPFYKHTFIVMNTPIKIIIPFNESNNDLNKAHFNARVRQDYNFHQRSNGFFIINYLL